MARIGDGKKRGSIRSFLGTLFPIAFPACGGTEADSGGRSFAASPPGTLPPPPEAAQDGDWTSERHEMVETQLVARGIRDPRILGAMRKVPRHAFAPGVDPARAYEDRPHPIGHGQTISQPYIVALMTELAALQPPCNVLEVGTGSGYQAAVLAKLGCSVHTIEIIEPLARQADQALAGAGYTDRVQCRVGDGYRGWAEHAPYDAVLVTAAAPRIPPPLLDQLRVGGRLVIPVGDQFQVLEVHRRTEQGFVRERTLDVRFVPMTGEVRRAPE